MYGEIRKVLKFRLTPYNTQFLSLVMLHLIFEAYLDKVISYPGTCVRNYEPVVTYRCEQQEIFASFIQDLHNRMPKMFDVPLRFTVSPFYPLSKLYSALCANQSNLTRTAPLLKNCRKFEFGIQTKNATLSGVDQPTCRIKSTESESTSCQTFTTSNITARTASPGEESTVVTTPPTAKKSRIIPTFTNFKSQSFTKGKHLTIQRRLKSIIVPSSSSVSSKPNSLKRKDISNVLEKSKNVLSSLGVDKENAICVKRPKSVKNTLQTSSSLRSTVDVSALSSVLDRGGTCTSTGHFAHRITREDTTKNSDQPNAIFESTQASSLAEKGILENISVRNLNGVQEPLNSDSSCGVETTNVFNKTNSVQVRLLFHYTYILRDLDRCRSDYW